MSEAIDDFRALKDMRKALREAYGVPCLGCLVTHRPRAHPTILMPQQRCRVDGYRDPRPELTQADYDAISPPLPAIPSAGASTVNNGSQSPSVDGPGRKALS